MKKTSRIIVCLLALILLAGCSIKKAENDRELISKFIENDYYSESFPFNVYRSGNVLCIRGVVSCKNANESGNEIAVLSGLPISAQNIYMTVSERTDNGKPIREHIDRTGNLLLTGGSNGGSYDIYIVYITEEKS